MSPSGTPSFPHRRSRRSTQCSSFKYTGTLTSRVMDGLSAGKLWTCLPWTPSLPFLKALPDAGASESQTSHASQSTNLMSGIVGLWHLDESTTGSGGTGKDFRDSSGNGNWGTLTGGVTQGISGKFNQVVRLNGTTGYVDLGNPPSLNT